MNNPFDYFKEIHCINLDKRKDRWDLAKEEFEKIGVQDRVKRFSAIEHRDGRIGCLKSHLEILKKAKEGGLENVLVFEDDVMFVNDTCGVVKKALEQIAYQWQLFYFGPNTHTKLWKISPNVVHVKNAFSTHAIAYHESVYDAVIAKLEATNVISNPQDMVDVWLAAEIQAKQMAVCTYPLTAIQRDCYSDVEKKYVAYDFITKRFNENTR